MGEKISLTCKHTQRTRFVSHCFCQTKFIGGAGTRKHTINKNNNNKNSGMIVQIHRIKLLFAGVLIVRNLFAIATRKRCAKGAPPPPF